MHQWLWLFVCIPLLTACNGLETPSIAPVASNSTFIPPLSTRTTPPDQLKANRAEVAATLSPATRRSAPTTGPSATPPAAALAPQHTSSAQTIAFVGVNVVPMDREAILPDQTVVIRGEWIIALGAAAEVSIPAGAKRIEGEGKYLLPGLADMHVHLAEESFLWLFVANGVTTVRNMAGVPRHLQWRAEIAAGQRLGPAIYTAGPILDGYPSHWPVRPRIEDPLKAERIIAGQKEAGYDFVKVYDGLTRKAFDLIMANAQQYELPVIGHVADEIGLAYVVAAGQQSIEHLDGFVNLDQAEIAAAMAAIRERGVWNTPTLVAFQPIRPLDETPEEATRPGIKYMSPTMLIRWNLKEGGHLQQYAYGQVNARRFELARALYEAGGRFLLGSDAPSPFVVPGFSIHQELQNLVAIGMTPYEALRAGTRDAAESLGASEAFGTVGVGRRADLILVDGNPLADIGNVARQSGVMVRGRWLPRAEIERILDDLSDRQP